MILYLSETKVNNLLQEMQFNRGIIFSPYRTIKLKVSNLEAETNFNEPNSLGHKLQAVVKYLKKSGALGDISCDKQDFYLSNYYKCFGAMHLHKVRDTMTGLVVNLRHFEAQSNTLLDFDIDICNCSFDKLMITCSAKNLRFIEFSVENSFFPNSMGDQLLSVSKVVPVELIFMLSAIDNKHKILFGSPLIITC